MESRSQHEYFGFITKRTISAFGYYNLILLAPTEKENYLSDRLIRLWSIIV